MIKLIAGFYIFFLLATSFVILLVNPELMEYWFIHTAYYWVALSVIWMIYFGSRAYLEDYSRWNHLLKRSFPFIVASVVICVVLSIWIKPELRVLADQTNIVAVSQSMHEDRTVKNVTAGLWVNGRYVTHEYEIPIRPLLLPFLGSMVHAIKGYDWRNLYVINAAALAILLSMIGVYFVYRKKPVVGAVAILLVIAQPVVSLTALSAGLEMLQITCIALTFALLFVYLSRPSSIKLAALMASLVLLLQTRYESVLIVVIIMGMLLLARQIPFEYVKKHIIFYMLSPLYVYPFLVQRLLTWGFENETDPTKNIPTYSLQYTVANIKHLLAQSVRWDTWYPYVAIINLLGLLGLGLILYRWIRERDSVSRTAYLWSSCVILSFVAIYALIISFYGGNPTWPISARYYALACIVFSIVASVTLFKLRDFPFRNALIILFSLVLLCIYLPSAHKNIFLNTQVLVREFKVITHFLDEWNNRRDLVIYDRPGMLVVQQQAAISFEEANHTLRDLNAYKAEHQLKAIFVVQRLHLKTEAPLSLAYFLNPAFKLKPLVTIPTSTHLLRISLLTHQELSQQTNASLALPSGSL